MFSLLEQSSKEFIISTLSPHMGDMEDLLEIADLCSIPMNYIPWYLVKFSNLNQYNLEVLCEEILEEWPRKLGRRTESMLSQRYSRMLVSGLHSELKNQIVNILKCITRW